MAEFPLAPGSTIGILGGGQLGRMLALAAARLGFDVVIQDPEEASPAGRVAARQIVATYDDRWALKRLAEACDVVTYEFENVPVESARWGQCEGGRRGAPQGGDRQGSEHAGHGTEPVFRPRVSRVKGAGRSCFVAVSTTSRPV